MGNIVLVKIRTSPASSSRNLASSTANCGDQTSSSALSCSDSDISGGDQTSSSALSCSDSDISGGDQTSSSALSCSDSDISVGGGQTSPSALPCSGIVISGGDQTSSSALSCSDSDISGGDQTSSSALSCSDSDISGGDQTNLSSAPDWGSDTSILVRPVVTLATFDFEKREPPALFSNGQLQDTANITCETILLGFVMSISTNLLLNGVIKPEYYDHTPNAERIQNELKKNSELWMSDKASIMFQRFEALKGLLDAVKMKDFEKIQKIYYRSQHQHVLGTTASPFRVPIYINSKNLHKNWIASIYSAIRCINTATPGLCLCIAVDKETSKICIKNSKNPKQAYTTFKSKKPYICLGSSWKGDFIGTATHELLHALGFQHEMQRGDADLYLKFIKHEKDGNAKQYEKLKQGVLTRFDPFSVLMYAENPEMERKKQDPIWKLKPSPDRLQRLSELNKVALNLVYEPVITDIYNPRISQQTGMLYCGRKVMETHNQCSPPTTDNCCGPNNWANCPACRVIKSIKSTSASLPTKIEKLELCLAKNKWQGLSGLFYCGTRYSDKQFYSKHNDVLVENDGICGGNNGIPCTNCGQMLFPGYSWDRFVFTPVYEPGYGPGDGPGYGPPYGPGYGPPYGPGYGPPYGPGYGPASYGPGYPPAYRH